MSNTYRDLKDLLGEVSKKAQKDARFKDDAQLAELNLKAMKLFTNAGPIVVQPNPEERPINVTRRSMIKMDIYLRRKGFNWTKVDWEVIKTWVADNWDKILKVLLSLLMFIIL